MRVLTIDLEEWFHLLDYDATRTEAEWGKFEVRIYENTERLLRILEDTGSSATFFVIGWIAKTYPDLVRRIAEKYPVGTHTENHQLIWQQTPEQFRADVRNCSRWIPSGRPDSPSALRRNGLSRFSRRRGLPWTVPSSRPMLPTAAGPDSQQTAPCSCKAMVLPSRSSR